MNAKGAAEARHQRQSALQEHRRDIILEAASKIFARDGLEGATMRAIAAEAGYAVGALYLHFEAKEQIYGELLARSLAELTRRLRAAAPPDLPAATRLAASLRAFFHYYREHPEKLSLGLYLGRGAGPRGLTPEQDRALNGRLIAALEIIAEPLRDLHGGAMEPAHSATVRLAALIVGTLLLEATGRLKVLGQKAESLVDEAIRDLLDNLPAK